MDRARYHVLRDLRHCRLHRRDHLAPFAPMLLLLVKHPGGVEHQQTELHIFDIAVGDVHLHGRSEEHTSELQSLMRISYAVFCLKKKKDNNNNENIMETYK